MSRHRVLLLGSQSLLAAGIEDILKRQGDIEVLGPYAMTNDAVSHTKALGPDLVVIADESPTDTALVALILQVHPELPIINVGLEESRVQIYKSERVAATAASFLATIRSLLTQPSTGERAP